ARGGPGGAEAAAGAFPRAGGGGPGGVWGPARRFSEVAGPGDAVGLDRAAIPYVSGALRRRLLCLRQGADDRSCAWASTRSSLPRQPRAGYLITSMTATDDGR